MRVLGPHPSATLQMASLFFFLLFRAPPVAYGSLKAKGLIRAVAASLHCSHSNTESKPCLLLTAQLMAMPDL